MKIILSGGGTLGSVSPLLAIAQELKKTRPDAEFLFVGTETGPEKEVVSRQRINFISIKAGKFRRYLSWRLLVDPFLVLAGFWQSIKIIKKFQPDIIITAGSFVSVPLTLAGKLLKKKIIVHQQDVLPGLANKLMALVADKISVTFKSSLKDFSSSKTVWTGNPYNPEILTGDKEQIGQQLGLDNQLPIILIVGGGTGAVGLNKLVVAALPELTKVAQIIHLTGKGKMRVVESLTNYHPHEFLPLAEVLPVVDLVISRCGMSIMTELAILGKPAILIPLPDTHQELNAQYFYRYNAAVVLKQKELTPSIFSAVIIDLLNNQVRLAELRRNIGKLMNRDANQKFVEEVLRVVSSI